jgi:hypothetical protein
VVLGLPDLEFDHLELAATLVSYLPHGDPSAGDLR